VVRARDLYLVLEDAIVQFGVALTIEIEGIFLTGNFSTGVCHPIAEFAIF
jgi:hypothetical protein